MYVTAMQGATVPKNCYSALVISPGTYLVNYLRHLHFLNHTSLTSNNTSTANTSACYVLVATTSSLNQTFSAWAAGLVSKKRYAVFEQ